MPFIKDYKPIALGDTNLFKPLKLGDFNLSHRVVQLPVNRKRIVAPGNIPRTEWTLQYYDQRTQVPGSFVIAEGTTISKRAGGYDNTPGIWSDDQIREWTKIIKKIHDNKCFVFMELSAVGRQAFPENLARDGLKFVSASDNLYLNEDLKERALKVGLPQHGLTEEEIKGFIHDYVTAAQNGISAGADGIEIAAGYGFLVNQFLDPVTNHRTDKYGGSIENRSRFLLEIIDTVGEAIGAENLAVRLSPWNKHGGMSGNNDPSNIAQYSYLIGELEKRAKAGKRLAFVDVVEGIDEGKYYPGSTNHKNLSNNDFVRSIWDGIILRSGELGANPELVKEFIQDERTLIGYGRAYIANPDLVVRLEQGLPLNAANVSTFYSGGKEGYLDYPTYSESLKLKWDKV